MIDELVARARKRLIFQEILSASLLGCSAFCGVVLLALSLGGRFLTIWLIAGAAVLSLGWIAWRVIRRVPSRNRAAILVDHRCRLADALSTEIHFRNAGSDVADVQRRQAEAAAQKVDLLAAFPYTLPRQSSIILGGLLLAILGVGTMRYGFRLELNPQSAVVPPNPDPFDLAVKADESALRRDANRDRQKLMADLGASTPPEAMPGDLDNVEGRSLSPDSAARNGQSSSDAKMRAPGNPPAGKVREQGHEGEPSGDSEAGAASPEADQPPSSRDGAPQGAQSASNRPGASSGSGLLNKLKDAMNSLMSKMRPQGQNASNGSQPGNQQASNQQSQKGQAGRSGQKGDRQGADQKGDSDAGEEAADSEFAQPGQGASRAEQNASAKPGSGMGKQDGSKELRDAEQQAAMGKLSEIIGRRSAMVSGEMTIESQSGPQQLRTAYSNSKAKHGEASSALDRDEVPVALQSYVQQYFEQVRKQAALKAAPNGKANN